MTEVASLDPVSLEPRRRLQPVQPGPGDVDHQDIWIEALHLRYGVVSIHYRADDFELFTQNYAHPCQNRFMIVSKQYSDLAHKAPFCNLRIEPGIILSCG